MLFDSRQGVKDTIVSAVPQIVGVFTGFFGSVLIARGLGPDGMGQYALVISLAGIATSLSDLGIGQTAIRYASRAAANNDTPVQMSVLRWALRWRLSLVFLSTTAFFLLAPSIAQFWHSETLTPYLRLGLLGGVFAALASVPTIYFQSSKRFSVNASVTSSQKIISFAGILVLSVFSLWSLRNVVLANLFASAIGALVFLIIVPKAAIWPRNAMRKITGPDLRRVLASPKIQHDTNNKLDNSSPVGFLTFHVFSVVIVTLTLQVDVWMMGYLLEKSELGIYSVATRFALPLTIALGALSTALWPRASGATDPAAVLSLMRRTFITCFLIGLCSILYALFVPLLAPRIFGSEYADSAFIGQLLCLRFFVSFCVIPVSICGYSFGLVRYYWMVNLLQLVAVVFMNALLLPILGPIAPALAILTNSLIGAFSFSFLFVLVYHRHVRNVEISHE
ncbi:MAG: oligosaccharide flippase family protein [Pirellulales bacterium]|nr:oligosaccharide flippase family protein [Pirellulales bacterium]